MTTDDLEKELEDLVATLRKDPVLLKRVKGSMQDGIFDGELLGRRLEAFLARVDHALNIAMPALTNFYVDGITVVLSVDAGFNVSFAGFGGINADRMRTFEFNLQPRKREIKDETCPDCGAVSRLYEHDCPLRKSAGPSGPP